MCRIRDKVLRRQATHTVALRYTRYALVPLLVAAFTFTAGAANLRRTYFMPLPEDNVFSALKQIHSVQSPMETRTSIVPSMTNTLVYYDHWEDGFEDDVNSPTQTTTEIWGDNIATNGIPPGFASDVLFPGDVVSLVETVAIPRDASVVLFDSSDKFVASLPVSVTRALNAKDPGEALAGAVNVYPFEDFGIHFRAPVGTDSDAGTLFGYSGLFIMAGVDATVVCVDSDNDGNVDVFELLNAGEGFVVDDVEAGASVTASRPVQCHLLTGSVSANFQMRWFTLFGEFLWDSDYVTPIGKEGNADARVWLYNPNATTITTRYETASSTGTITIASETHGTFNMPEASAAHFYTDDGSRFIPVEAIDYGGHQHDWGVGLIPTKMLTELSLVGWGPGSGKATVNTSPLWVTPVSNTTLYVDYDGDPTTGSLTDPKGNKYDVSTNVNALGSYKIYDNSDKDQTSMRVYTLDDVDISTAWGQDGDAAAAGNPHLDMGYALMPLPRLLPEKSSSLHTDADGDGFISPGDTLIYTVMVTRIVYEDLDDVVVADTLSANLVYVTNSVMLNGTNITDDVVPPAATKFPLDEGGYNIGPVPLDTTATITYQASIVTPFPPDEDGVANIFRSAGVQVTLFTPLQGGLVSGKVVEDTDADGDLNDPDTGISGVTIELFTDPNGDGDPADGSSVSTNITGSRGNYFFRNLTTGDYVVVESDPVGFFSTGDRDGVNDNRIAATVDAHSSTDNDFADALSGLTIMKSASPPGIWFPDLDATYTITILNTGATTHLDIDVTDPMLTGLTYMPDSTRVLYDGVGTNTFADNFGNVSYGNNSGSEDWLADWSEVDDGGAGPTMGAVQIVAGELRLTDGVAGTPSLTRCAELTGYTSAVLRFDYDASADTENSDVISLLVSTDGSSWSELDTFQGDVDGSAGYDITDYMSVNTYIQFAIGQGYNEADEYFYVDDLEIEAIEVVSRSSTGAAPPNLIQDYEIIKGGSIQITFTATVASVDGVTNTACVTSHIETNAICSTVIRSVDTNAVPDRIGGQVRNDLDGDGDETDADVGIPGVTIEVFTDPNGDGNPADGSSIATGITQSAGYFLFGALTSGYYVLAEMDLSGFESTGDSDGLNNNQIPVHLPGGVDSLTNNFLDWTISGLDIFKTASESGAFDHGQTVSYSISVSNTRVAAQGSVAVTDILPPELTYVPGSVYVTCSKPVKTNIWLDAFGAVAYTNSDGSADWSTSWLESGDDGSPFGGDVRVLSDLGDDRVYVRDDNNKIQRSADLSAYTNAVLAFDFRRHSVEAGEYVAIQVSTNALGDWTELDRFEGPVTDGSYAWTNFDISPYIATNTTIRFASPSGGMNNNDGVYFDNVKLTAVAGGITGANGDPPPTLISGFIVEPEETITITFDAAVGVGDEAVNMACVTTAGDTNGLCAFVTNEVSAIVLTQGVVSAVTEGGGLHLAWTAATDGQDVSREYDLLWVDRGTPGFHASLTNEWAKASTVTDSHYTDTGGVGRASPMALGNAMRFYRAARKDSWALGNEARFASKEIYVAKRLNLEEGENWISLLMVPDSNCVAHVFGTNLLPAGSVLGDATRIEWYGATQAGVATNVVWLSSDGLWMFDVGGVADDYPLPLNEGFNVVIPPGSNAQQVLVMGRVPEAASAAYGHQVTLVGSGKYNVVSYNVPYKVQLKDSGLREAGFTGAPSGQNVNPNNSDELRILRKGGGSLASPRARILMNGNDEFVFWTGGNGSAEHYRLLPDDALLIYTKATTSNLTWSISLPYAAPTVQFSP